jgi:hypothetical protein
MVKMARLPNPTFADADLDSNGERLSRVPLETPTQSNVRRP